ncbi:MAG: allantoate amidohydrolase [Nocardioidaceae bacterium]
MTADFEQMWRDLAVIGRSAATGGYFRQPFASAERECLAWFREQARARGLRLETDRFGNTVGWWDVVSTSSTGGDGSTSGAGVLTGSHLDSVLDGGAYDGPLGVVTALAAVDLLRERGVTPSRPLGVGVFVEEEGSRFGLACLGSRLATGATTWDRARALTDRDGVSLEDALAGTDTGDADLLRGVGCFVELHVEQGRDLVDRDAAVGVASGIWPHGRYRFEFTGEANHAGTTRMEDRHDPMLSCATTVLAAHEQARLSGQRATFGRLEVRPNGTNAVPSQVTAWLDARAETVEHLEAMLAEVERLGHERARRDGTGLTVTAESVSAAVRFDPDLARRLAEPRGWPLLPTMAGHDAGVLSAAGVPTAMLFVRNPTGVSHSPAEHAAPADCLEGVTALADVLEDLTS